MVLTRTLACPAGRQITRARFERGLRHTHHVVVRDDLLRAIICHRNDAAAVRHQRGGGARQRGERIRAHFKRREKCVARSIQNISLQCFFGRVGNAVDEEIQPTKHFSDTFEGRLYFQGLRHVARQD